MQDIVCQLIQLHTACLIKFFFHNFRVSVSDFGDRHSHLQKSREVKLPFMHELKTFNSFKQSVSNEQHLACMLQPDPMESGSLWSMPWQRTKSFPPLCHWHRKACMWQCSLCIAHVMAHIRSLFNDTGSVFVLCLCFEGAASPCSISHFNPKASVWKNKQEPSLPSDRDLTSHFYNKGVYMHLSVQVTVGFLK